MAGTLTDSDKCEPNLVPMLDMVFQLMTFFMMVVNFQATAVDRELVLPVIGSAKPLDAELVGDLLVLNLRANGEVSCRGELLQSASQFIANEAQAAALRNGTPRGAPLPVRVVLRGDRSISAKGLMELVDLCRKNGFEKFDFAVKQSAAAKSKGP